jgi:hypothetical protein
MASDTKHTENVRLNKKGKMGKKRKTWNRVHGSTPVFPIHPVDKDAKPAATQN